MDDKKRELFLKKVMPLQKSKGSVAIGSFKTQDLKIDKHKNKLIKQSQVNALVLKKEKNCRKEILIQIRNNLKMCLFTFRVPPRVKI